MFFVDLLPEQKGILDELLKKHTALERAGTEPGTAAIIMKDKSRYLISYAKLCLSPHQPGRFYNIRI